MLKCTLELARSEGRAYFGIDGDRLPIIKRYQSEVRDGVAPRTWWAADEVGTNQGAKRDHLRKQKDKWDNWVISKEYNAAMLAEAVCKLEGFTYAPSDSLYWQHGHSTEQDFLYVTTASLKHVQLQQLSDEVGPERTLLVVCTSFRGSKEGYPNLTVKKVPKAVLNRCEWGKDDYSLRVENLPDAPPKPGQQDLF